MLLRNFLLMFASIIQYCIICIDLVVQPVLLSPPKVEPAMQIVNVAMANIKLYLLVKLYMLSRIQ